MILNYSLYLKLFIIKSVGELLSPTSLREDVSYNRVMPL